jgi:gliding motility-associated-like protein
MKIIIKLLFFFILFSNLSFAGGGGCTTAPSSIPAGCAGADPFCTGTTYTFTNTTGTGDFGDLDCLLTTPNPTWYYLKIATGGNIDIAISQTNTSGSGIDVDFALLGPYNDLATACANPSSGCVEDCSYSPSPTETASITGAVAGEFYLLLLTNFSNQAGTITFNQTGGGGATDCSILLPPCSISGLTSTPSACNASNQYNVTGSVTFANPPTTGTLTVTSSCGGSQTFSAPFTSPQSYTLSNLTSNGAACTVTASFSADAACTSTANYTAPNTVTPTFAAVPSVCQNATAPVLPTTSTNGITGTWSPAVSTAAIGTTTYTFTPNAGQCAVNTTTTITVTTPPTPTFPALANVCQNAAAPILPTTSNEGITGTWSPAVSTAAVGSTTYTFTPTAGQCATTATNTLTVTTPPTPTFPALANVCQNTTAPVLPTTSNEGITGTWSPAVSTAAIGTTAYTFTPTAGQCALTATNTLTVTTPPTPTFPVLASVCQNAIAPVLPTTSNEGITGSWSPAVSTASVGTTTYTFTPTAGQCGTTATNTLTVTAPTTPTFAAVPNVCQNAVAPVLPTTSTNGITGTWSPAVSTATAGTLTYTFTPTAGVCATTATNTITVDPLITPTFAAIPNVCQNATAPVLPTTSTNGITGTWSPAVSTAASGTTTYTFTPSVGQCAATTTLNITVDPLITPTFNPVASVCQGAAAPVLPGTSTNGIVGIWSPAVSTATAGTTTYTFTPNAGQCAATTTLNVTIDAPITPTFAAVPNVCQNGVAPVLPTTSTNGVTGTWSPAVSTASAGTTTYTFTPTAGLCATTTTLTITVDPEVVPTFNPLSDVCLNAPLPTLATTSTNGIVGTWSPVVSTSTAGTTTYTFTPNLGQCATTTTTTLTVTNQITPTFAPVASVCLNAPAPVLPTTSTNGITGVWSPAVSTSAVGTVTYSFTSNPGQCAGNTTNSITVTTLIVPTFNPTADVCQNEAAPILPATSNEGIVGVWSPAVSTSTAGTTTYTFTPNAGQCGDVATTTLTVDPLITPTFNPLASICIGSVPPVLPTTSVNGIVGVWSPVVSTATAGTTTYTFTPNVGQCAATTTLNLTVDPQVTPTFAAVPNVCQNSVAPVLPTTSTNGITGTWSPAVSTASAGTTTYTFTPDAGQCATTTALGISVDPQLMPTFNPISPVCQNSVAPTLPATSTNGIAGTWLPAVSTATSGTTVYTFTPNAGICATTNTLSITVNPEVTPAFAAVPNLCQNAPAPVLPTTSTNGITGTWLPAVSTSTSGSTVYTFTPDAGQCALTTTLTITVDPEVTPTFNPLSAICQNGVAPVLPTTSVNGIVGTWDATVNAATAGLQNFTFTPNLGQCATNQTLSITVNPLPAVSAGTDQTICIGDAATLSGSGANTYSWNNGVTDGVAFNPATTNTYTVTGTDINGCVNTDQVIVTIVSTPIVNAGLDQAICIGESITLTATGATTYSWDNGVTNGVAFTPAGTTTYTVTGTAGTCIATDQVTITVNPLPTIDAGVPQSVCIGGTVTLSGSGGITYAWDNGVNNGIAFSPAATTTYTVTGTDANGCENTDQVTVTVNPLPTVSAGADQTVCIGDAVTLSGSGAVTYTWNNGVTNNVSFNPAATNTYTVTGTDANGCVNTDQVIVTIVSTPIVNAGLDQAICIGESITLTATGATTYSWDNGVTNGVAFTPAGTTTYTVTGTAGTCIATDQVTITVNPLPTIDAGVPQSVCIGGTVTLSGSGGITYAWDNGVNNGIAFSPAATTTYAVTGTLANGCENTDQVTVTVNPLPTVSAGPDQTVCIGDAVTLSGSGAVTYTWNNGVTNNVSFNPAATNTYTVTGTDANGCVNIDQVMVTIVSNPIVNAGLDQTICIGQSITLSATGATTYSWDNGVTNGVAFTPAGTTTYTVTGTAGTCIATDQVTITVNPLPNVNAGFDQTVCIGSQVTLAGSGANTYSWTGGVINNTPFTPIATITYTVTGADANGCQNSDQVLVTVNPLPVISAGPDVTVCVGGSVTLNGSGGALYAWNNGVTNGVSFIPPATNTYTVTGTDGNGCQNTDNVLVTVLNLPAVSAGNDISICIGQTVTLNGAGASSFTWDNGVQNGVPFSPTFTNTYTVTGTIGNCSNTDQVTVTVNQLPTVDAGNPVSVCFGNTVTLNGTGASTYTWDNGAVNGLPFSPGVTNTYTVIGTDVNGCQNSDQVVITVNPLPIVDAGQDIVVCPGEAFVVVGNGAVNYTWNNGAVNGVPLTVATTTTFTVTGTDVNGCQGSDFLVVTALPAPPVNAGPDFTICAGDSAVLIGTGAPVLTWDNGVLANQPFTPSMTTTYTLSGVDANGCTNADQVTITVSPIPTVQFIPDVTNGCAPLDVTFTVQSAPGTSCVWDFGDGTTGTGCGTVTHTYNGIGCFDVSMSTTSADGCVGSQTYTDLICLVTLPEAEFTVNPAVVTMVNSYATMNNMSQNAVEYEWNFGDGSETDNSVNPQHLFPFTEPGTYEIMLIAYNEIGCADTAIQTIRVNEDVVFYVPNSFTPDDDSYNPVFLPVFTSGYDPMDYRLLIYDRWGEIIFESLNAKVGWPGTYGVGGELVQDGTYVWTIEFKSTIDGSRIKKNGHITLIR